MSRKEYGRHRSKMLASLLLTREKLERAYAVSDWEIIATTGDELWQSQEVLAKLRRKYYGVKKKRRAKPETKKARGSEE